MNILERLKLPEAKESENLDDLQLTGLHADILHKKRFLKKLYFDFYRRLKESIDDTVQDGSKIIELGSGGGFIKDVIPNAITSDVLNIPSVDLIFSALEMPFEDRSVDAIVMIDVLHHIPDVKAFFREVVRFCPEAQS